MSPKLSKELATALHATGADALEVIDPDTGRVYMIVDGETHHRAMLALRRQQDQQAIAEGLAQLEAGEGRRAEEAFKDIRTRLGFRQQT
jgi:predicted transcriptional regulator